MRSARTAPHGIGPRHGAHFAIRRSPGLSAEGTAVIIAVLLLVAGLAVLAWAADQFVVGAARLARRLQVPAVVVGVVVVGFGTSLPEALVSALAAGRGEVAVAVGNIVGSNIANLSLLLGVGALIAPLAVGSGVVRREIPLVIAATAALAVAVQGTFAAWRGVALFAGMAAILIVVVRSSMRARGDVLGGETDEFLEDGASTAAEAARTVLGLLGILAASQAVLTGALDIAEELDLAAGFVGVTIVAVGTSLPELVTVIQSARRGESDLVVGNLLGSNLFNSLAVGGMTGMIAAAPVGDVAITTRAVASMGVVTVLAAVLLVTGRRITRLEAVILLVAYAASLVLL